MKQTIFASLTSLIIVASAAIGSPVITGVSFSGSPGNYAVTVNGSGFGSLPASFPFYGDTSNFRMADAAQLGHGEWGYSGDGNGLTYESWSDSQVQVSGFGGQPGDAVAIALWNPTSGFGATWGGNVPGGSGAPQITSVTFSGTGQNLQIDIHGSGFGSAPVAMPYTGDLNQFSLGDFQTHCGGGSSQFEVGSLRWGNGSPDSLTLNYQSWSDSEIVIDGFSGTYGQGCDIVQNGDPMIITLWNSTDTGQTGPQTAWGGFVNVCSADISSSSMTSWSGYAVGTPSSSSSSLFQSGAVGDVKATWIVPTIEGQSVYGSSSSSTWIGIGGLASSGTASTRPLVQIGTTQERILGTTAYYAWFEVIHRYLPGPPIPLPYFPVKPGDTVSADVSYIGNGKFELAIENLSRGVSHTENVYAPFNTRETAEWIVESPASLLGRPALLADFGTESFSDCSVTLNSIEGPINGCGAIAIELIMKKNGVIKAQPSELSDNGSAFSVTWRHQ
jgi:hypothetical protein